MVRCPRAEKIPNWLCHFFLEYAAHTASVEAVAPSVLRRPASGTYCVGGGGGGAMPPVSIVTLNAGLGADSPPELLKV